MSFILHPGWQRYSPHLKIERARTIEIAFVAEPKIRAAAEKLRMACIACGRPISPIRARTGRYLYMPFCPPGVRRSCAEDKAVADEYKRIERIITSPSET